MFPQTGPAWPASNARINGTKMAWSNEDSCDIKGEQENQNNALCSQRTKTFNFKEALSISLYLVQHIYDTYFHGMLCK